MYSARIVNPAFAGDDTGSEITFRQLPERDPKEVTARKMFEAYGGTVQSMKAAAGMGAVSGALVGAKAGIPGAIIGAALGALSGFWKGKAYRTRAYAQLDALGLLRKPRFRYRSVTYLRNQEFVFMRYPYAEQTALVIVPILQGHYPHMTVQELTKVGQASQVALIKFRQQNSDVPLALAAETILAYYGILRNAAGVYDLAYKPEPGAHYHPPPEHIPSIPSEPPPIADSKRTSYLWIAAGVVAAFLIYRR